MKYRWILHCIVDTCMWLMYSGLVSLCSYVAAITQLNALSCIEKGDNYARERHRTTIIGMAHNASHDNARFDTNSKIWWMCFNLDFNGIAPMQITLPSKSHGNMCNFFPLIHLYHRHRKTQCHTTAISNIVTQWIVFLWNLRKKMSQIQTNLARSYLHLCWFLSKPIEPVVYLVMKKHPWF